MNISIIILAAGSASRMGEVKQLLPYSNSTLLEVAIQNALTSKASKVYCVLGANSEVIKSEIKVPEITFVNNPNWKEGLSSSIVAGIKHLEVLRAYPDAILIVLADQPNVNSDYIDVLIDTYQDNQHKIIASAYEDKNGVPAIFPRSEMKNLLELKGDKGAKSFLNNVANNVITFRAISSDSLRDIDTPEDYKRNINK